MKRSGSAVFHFCAGLGTHMSVTMLRPPLRLGLVFFDSADQRALRAVVNWCASEQLPWIVVDERPYHALLLARGTRHEDPDDLAVMRLGADAESTARRIYGDAMPPMALRKPLQPMHVRIVLEMAAASLIPEHVEAHSPQTRPRARDTQITDADINAVRNAYRSLTRPGFDGWH
jgi:hypothetical protein